MTRKIMLHKITTSVKKVSLMALLCLFALNLFSQNTSNGRDFIKKLLKDEGGSNAEFDLSEIPYSVQTGEEGDRYSVSFSIMAHDDLNDDGVDDYVVHRNSEGMLGGNANTNGSIVYYIMKDSINVLQKHEILLYAPFSYNILGNISFKNGVLYATATKNGRTYIGEEEVSHPVSFIYQGSNVYEDSYLKKCGLGTMKNKSIFKSNTKGQIARSVSIDMHNYCEISNEKFVRNDTVISIKMSGCDNLDLCFDVVIPVAPQVDMYKKTVIGMIDFLAENTRYETVLNEFCLRYIVDANYAEDERKQGRFDTWTYDIYPLKSDDDNSFRFRFFLKNILNPLQDENWNITTRKKGR